MSPYIDLHTHRIRQDDGVISVCNMMLHASSEIPTHLFTAGLHPWYADQLSTENLRWRLDQCVMVENFVAFGETGLDKVCKVPMQLQLDAFELHLNKAVEHCKPIILHCVKAWDELTEMADSYPAIKILHGYNGSTQLTDRLLKSGFLFSIGKGILNSTSKIHSAINIIPVTSLFCETDTSDVSIQEIYKGFATARKVTETELRDTIYANFSSLRIA
jgi:TatD DNase family protein